MQAADGQSTVDRATGRAVRGRGFRQAALSLLVALAAWTIFTWPLAPAVTRAIPSSAYNVEKHSRRAMIPGDHLQFLYHLWLGADTIAGPTPWFHNLYEFNTGDDAERREFSTYYLPFSLFFMVGDVLGNAAVAWNLTQIAALWLAFWFTWRLTRRYAPDEATAALAASAALLLPFRWITLLDGSPSGLALMWIPLVLWGVDVWVSERRAAGAAAAAGAVFLAGLADTHVFFFGAMLAPAWAVFALLWHGVALREGAVWRGWLKSAWPLLAGGLLVAAQVWMTRRGVADTALATGGGRPLSEIALWSPALDGVVRFFNPEDNRKIYLGIYLLVLLPAGAVAALVAGRATAVGRRRALAGVLLLLGLAAVVLLATGLRNPWGEPGWRRVMRLIPPYRLIRQPDKIFILMPSLVAVALAVLGVPLAARLGPRRRALALALLLLPLAADYRVRIRATLCLLDPRQDAYAAVARDAAARGARPHVLILPLWPGDSHYGSLYQYYISRHRLRMVNGYRPTPRQAYLREMFAPFEPFNKGHLDEARLDELRRRGVGYLILHEDLFPEKVSPFPVGWTLQRLLNHPRLALIARDGAAWAFRIRAPDKPAPSEPALAPAPPAAFAAAWPARRWSLAGAARSNGAERVVADGARRGEAARLAVPGAELTSPNTQAPLTPGLHWLLRWRGQGRVRVETFTTEGDTLDARTMVVAAADWTWTPAPIPARGDCPRIGFRLILESGAVETDYALLLGEDWAPPAPGETRVWKAPAFFHAGYADLERGAVMMRRDHEPEAIVFYGPMLPFEPGDYAIELVFRSAAAPGTRLGRFNIRKLGDEEDGWVEVAAGRPARTTYRHTDNLSLFLAFVFERNADLEIEQVRWARVR